MKQPKRGSERESEIEKALVETVKDMGGKSWKFKSVNNRGVSDRIVALPNGDTWFVEVKTKGGKLSPLQEMFEAIMIQLHQNYQCIWSIEQIKTWRKNNE